jgi:RNA polymerase sigma-70 factor (ECF subfamily)
LDWHARFLRGDKDVIEEIYKRTFDQIRQAAGGVLRDAAERDAIVHDVFVDLLADRPLRESHRGGEFGAWLAAIARHRALDFVRRQGRLTELSAAAEAALIPDPVTELRDELRRFGARLEPRRRRLLELRYLQGMTQMEAAAALGVPRSTLEDWERQLRRLLVDFLSPDGTELS